eukprot:81048_1
MMRTAPTSDLLLIPGPIPLRKPRPIGYRDDGISQKKFPLSARIPLVVGLKLDSTEHNLSDETIGNILNLFVGDTDYNVNSRTVANGFIDRSQSDIASIIPRVVSDLCYSYCFESDNKYVFLAYNLYKQFHLHSKADGLFTENDSSSVIRNRSMLQSHFQNGNVSSICRKLMELNLVELSSFQTSFLSLFSDSKITKIEGVQYRLTAHTIAIFASYCSKK